MSAPIAQLVFDLEEAQQTVDEIAGQMLGEGRRDIARKAVAASEQMSNILNELLEHDTDVEGQTK